MKAPTVRSHSRSSPLHRAAVETGGRWSVREDHKMSLARRQFKRGLQRADAYIILHTRRFRDRETIASAAGNFSNAGPIMSRTSNTDGCKVLEGASARPLSRFLHSEKFSAFEVIGPREDRSP